jgi:Tfp pilus assembly protein PilV
MAQESGKDPKTAYEQAKRALENSTLRLVRAFVSKYGFNPGPRRPVGSPPNYRIPAETGPGISEQPSSEALYSFDSKSGKLYKSPHKATGAPPRKSYAAQIEEIALEIWDRTLIQMHMNTFAAYVDAYVRYKGYTAEVSDEIAREALGQAALAQQLDAGDLDQEMQRFARDTVIQRCDRAHSAYLSHQSVQTTMELLLTSVEAQQLGLEDHPIVKQIGAIISELLKNNKIVLGE